MILVIIGVCDGKMIRPRTFTDENVAMTELRNMYAKKLAEYVDMVKDNDSYIQHSGITDDRAFIGSGFTTIGEGFTREHYYEIQLHTTMVR
jgi:hypothetical protein